MSVTKIREEESGPPLTALVSGERSLRVALLTEADTEEVLEFLSPRPIHTVYLASLVRDNGISSPLNRGSFFGCRDQRDLLTGVALIGHATIIETENESCIEAFAMLAKSSSLGHLIRGEQEKVKTFWSYYAKGNHAARLLCGELLLELRSIPGVTEIVPGLRLATMSDLDIVVTVNAEMACDESGVNPLKRDAQGFRDRTALRIGKGRVWVWVEEGQLLFKTDIIAETPQTIYVEGVYVEPQHRSRGYGLRCMSQLAGMLLQRTNSICLTVNAKADDTQRFYRRAGYEVASRYDTIYLQSDSIS
ncbi:MAG: GNAT family N-acetyltransferase [bacterium]